MVFRHFYGVNQLYNFVHMPIRGPRMNAIAHSPHLKRTKIALKNNFLEMGRREDSTGMATLEI